MTRTKQGRRFGRGRYNGQPEQGGMMQGQEVPPFDQMQQFEQVPKFEQAESDMGMEGHAEDSEMGMNPEGQFPIKEESLMTDVEMPSAKRFDMDMIGQDHPGFHLDQQYRDEQEENFIMMNRGQSGDFPMGMPPEGQEGMLPGEPGGFNRGNFRGRWRGRGRGRGRGYAGFPMQRKRKAPSSKVEGKFECEICSKTFTGPVPFNFHMDGKNHQKKVKLISDAKDNPLPEGETPYQCLTCNKTFVAQHALEEHNAGKKHLKKIKVDIIVEDLRSRQLKDGSATDEGNQMMMLCEEEILTNNCFTCKKPFTGPIPFHLHLQGKPHKLAVMKKLGILKTEGENGTATKEMSEEAKETSMEAKEASGDGKEASGDGKEASGDGKEASGDGKETSDDGKETPGEEKEASGEAMEQTSGILDFKPKIFRQPKSLLHCEPCNKKFTGPIPYNEHLKNPKHLKRIQGNSFTTTESHVDPPVDSSAPATQLQPELPKIENNSESVESTPVNDVV